jgi:hypothetical protein
MNKPVCSNCRFRGVTGTQFYECLRHAPVTLPGPQRLGGVIDSHWPMVEPDQWCGDHMPDTVPIPPGECTAPDCDCEPGWCRQRVPATFKQSARPLVAGGKENAVQQAQGWAQEARTQRATVLSILRYFGLPERDYEALALIKAKYGETAPDGVLGTGVDALDGGQRDA